jgi:hypothetical protein
MGYIRFFLTILPPLLVAAMWCLMRMTQQARPRALSAVAAGVVVAIASGVSLYGATPSLENEYRTGTALAAAGRKVVAAAPAGSVVFSEERFLNHLQYVGDYQLYSPEIFNRAYIQRLERIDPDAPQGLQPQRAQFLYRLLRNNSDAELTKKQGQIISNAHRAGKRVFAVLPGRRNDPNRRRSLPTASFEVKTIATWDEMPAPQPDPRRGGPGVRRGRPNPNQWGRAGPNAAAATWEIVEIKPKPPSTRPSAPTTRPAT